MEPDTKAAFLFPGNDIDYRETLQKIGREDTFRENLAKVYKLGYRLNLAEAGAGAGSELHNQMVIYTICCSICDLYQNRHIVPAMVSGYSLGIYSALYAAGAYSFETGLLILREAFKVVKQVYTSRKRKFGMGVVIGLTQQEIIDLIFNKIDHFLEIACLNGERSFVIVGEHQAIGKGLDLAGKLGALKTIQINTKFGYHTSFLQGNIGKLSTFLDSCEIFEPHCRILSPLDMSLIGRNAITHEIVRNLYSPVRWGSLINELVNHYDIGEGYEAGPGESLAKMSRYINQNFKVYTFHEGKP
ncbi:MAG: hypothetical protein AB1611_00130 [bacterium]